MLYPYQWEDEVACIRSVSSMDWIEMCIGPFSGVDFQGFGRRQCFDQEFSFMSSLSNDIKWNEGTAITTLSRLGPSQGGLRWNCG